MSTPYVEYEYADGSANSLRPTRVRYPDGRELDYAYGASGSDDDRLSRVYQLKDGATVLAQYDYLGAAGIVRCELPQPQLRWNLSPSGNSFSGLDALDRTVDCLWQKYAPSAGTPVQIGYTYDRSSNRTSRDVAGTTGNDELYRYDGLNRLTDLDRGDLAAAKITAPQAAEQWRLDATGNWGRYENLDFVTPGNSLDQDRSANRANEITGFTSTVGASWSQPAYDRAGNMTTFPQPAAPASSFTATYDAWNRLVGLSGGNSYAYDALNRRTEQVAGGVTRHYYYSTSWQVLEERLGTSPDAAAAERQFVWGQRYIDDLVLRDRSPTNDGTLSERLYALQDANWNVVAVADTDGAVQERYRYSAYGTPTFLQADFTPRSPNQSGYDWETLYAGYRFDKASGLYQVRFRYLNSTVGQWVTRDPLFEHGAVGIRWPQLTEQMAATNQFVYCSCSPLQSTDALGLDEDCCVTVETLPQGPGGGEHCSNGSLVYDTTIKQGVLTPRARCLECTDRSCSEKFPGSTCGLKPHRLKVRIWKHKSLGPITLWWLESYEIVHTTCVCAPLGSE
ncbi:MAG: hypothetical protein J0M17_09870 [Planctomycetes bacterium]|nr:hypothetical protein [Planctomycetota bacterium]